MATLSRARREGLEAFDRRLAEDAEVERVVGAVVPVAADAPDEREEWEPGPEPWPIW